jgi:5-oxoprolinase (ATP-hydrolysing) subunit A
MGNIIIDINCDMGEGSGPLTKEYKDIFQYISSCNISCGIHAGDPIHIEQTIEAAICHNIRIGAHPSYPDSEGFGRRKMFFSSDELKAIIKYQIAALKGITESHGGKLSYVKPHGALYNEIAKNRAEALTVIDAILSIDPELAIMGLAGSELETFALQSGINFIPEAFADRRYSQNGNLIPRTEKDAVIHDKKQVLNQIISLTINKNTETENRVFIPVNAKSICIHGDNPAALNILKHISFNLHKHNIQLVKY